MDELAKASIARAKRAGNRLAGLLWFKYGDKQLAINALKIPAEILILQQYGIMPELFVVAVRQAIKWIYSRTNQTHGGTVLPNQKAQFEWMHTH